MNNIISFLSDNIITVLIIAITVITLFLNWLVIKNKPNTKVGSDKRHQLSNKEYKILCENSDNSIVNTTVSFGADLCNNKNEVDDMYSRTVIVGNRILRQEGFRISVVTKV